jgi:hypothetical protein
MNRITIDRFRIVPAPLTGIGWVAVQEWDNNSGEYKHVGTFRSRDEVSIFLSSEEIQLAR